MSAMYHFGKDEHHLGEIMITWLFTFFTISWGDHPSSPKHIRMIKLIQIQLSNPEGDAWLRCAKNRGLDKNIFILAYLLTLGSKTVTYIYWLNDATCKYTVKIYVNLPYMKHLTKPLHSARCC